MVAGECYLLIYQTCAQYDDDNDVGGGPLEYLRRGTTYSQLPRTRAASPGTDRMQATNPGTAAGLESSPTASLESGGSGANAVNERQKSAAPRPFSMYGLNCGFELKSPQPPLVECLSEAILRLFY